MKRVLLVTVLAGGLVSTAVTSALAQPPADANCLGADLSGAASSAPGFGQFISSLGEGGVGEEVLAHLQGIPTISNCPDNGFPTPLP